MTLEADEAELNRLAEAAVAHKLAEEAKLAKMTPAEREAYIRAWAERIAPGEVEAGCAYDDWANGRSPSEDTGR